MRSSLVVNRERSSFARKRLEHKCQNGGGLKIGLNDNQLNEDHDPGSKDPRNKDPRRTEAGWQMAYFLHAMANAVDRV